MNIVIKTVRLGVLGIAALGLSACAASAGAHRAAGAISVVTSTNVYADIAAQVAGRLAGSRVHITSLIANPDADPHSFEASARSALAISRADLIIENGGGYDDFMDALRGSTGGSGTVVNAVDLSGKRASGGDRLNEHVWYDIPTVARLAKRISDDLGEKDRADAATFRANAAAFERQLTTLRATESAIRTDLAGAPIAVTEPVPLYLLQACGFVDMTPPEFSAAVEQGTEVSPRVLQQTELLFSDNPVRMLVYNRQTDGPETTAVLDAAHAHHIPVVPVTETLPAGKTYVTWMAGVLAAVRAAVPVDG